MPTAGIMKRIAESPPPHRDRIVSGYYLLTMLAGALVLFFHGRLAFAADLTATIVYVAVTILFYALSKKRLPSDDQELKLPAPENRRTAIPAHPLALQHRIADRHMRANRNARNDRKILVG